ncbi:hypothetical protein SS50377_21177 [Spironucleus salmonicida]|uniref:Uncharacterized protein n=1 Tax=Spironucleus salmonicida TaxID=348837 RepID=A0A9P8M0T5_9EUKA|nr:hypothetical protein SS50377_21177 [Spironucleus salmonicida]
MSKEIEIRQILQHEVLTDFCENKYQFDYLYSLRNEIQLIRFDLQNFNQVLKNDLKKEQNSILCLIQQVNDVFTCFVGKQKQVQHQNKNDEEFYLRKIYELQKNVPKVLIDFKNQTRFNTQSHIHIIKECNLLRQQIQIVQKTLEQQINFQQLSQSIIPYIKAVGKAASQLNTKPQFINQEINNLLLLIKNLNIENQILIQQLIDK